MIPQRRKLRTLGQQIDEICRSKGILKRDIANLMGFSHSYLSQMIARGGTTEQIEALTKALGMKDSFYFDRYHILTLLSRVESGEEFAQTYAFAMIDSYDLPVRKRNSILEELKEKSAA